MRNTRYGQGWGNTPSEFKRTNELVEQMITRDVLANHSWRYGGAFASTTYMWLVRNEARALAKKFPTETHFDDMVLKEAAREKYVDEAYFQQGGRDEKRRIRDLAADLVAQAGALPNDARDPQPCRLDLFLQMQSRGMDATPAKRDAMFAKIEAAHGKTRFDETSMGRSRLQYFGDLKEPEIRQDFFKRLSMYLDRAEQSSVRVSSPNLYSYRTLDAAKPLTDEELETTLRLFSPRSQLRNLTGNGADSMARRLLQDLVAADRRDDLFENLPGVWAIAAAHHSFQESLVQRVIEFQQQSRYDLAAAISAVGLDVFPTQIRQAELNRLRVARSQSMLKVGGVAAVDPSDPMYAILSSQADFLTGNLERAWQAYSKKPEMALAAVQQLDPAFVVWLINKNTALAEFDPADELAREALQRMESHPEQYSRQARARMLLAYAQIAMERPEYPRARALFGRIAAAKEFEGSREQVTAELKVSEVDRVTKHYGEAVERLERL
ncbi:MAG: hypothetical protein N2C14_27075, partial [Planctomycetales bacterium]